MLSIATLVKSIFFALSLNMSFPTFSANLPVWDTSYEIPHQNADFDPVAAAIFDAVDPEPTYQVKVIPQDIITLIETLGGFDIIKEPFFLHTNTLNKRSILDNSFFVPFDVLQNKDLGWHVRTSAFYLYTNRSYFTKDADHLDAYLALSQETLLEKIENALNMFRLFNPDFEFDIRLVFSLFTNMTVEDRNSGFMLEAARRWDRSFFRIATPWYYGERNFFLTPAEKKLVEQEFGAFDGEEQEDFQKEHLVSDKFGLGDTRLEFGYQAARCRYASYVLGIQGTIPTAFKWFDGPKGSTFKRLNTLPTLDTDFLFDLIESPTTANQEKSFEIISDLATGALDRLAANLLDTPLGNGRHVGLGMFHQVTFDLDQFIDSTTRESQNFINARCSLEYLFPAQEKRYFITKFDAAGFAQRNFDDSDQSTNNLNFLTNELIARYYLRAFDTYVQPGLILHMTGEYVYQHGRWRAHVGNDFWFQSQEKLHWIHAQNAHPDLIDIPKARGPLAYQNTLFGGIVYSMKRPSRTLHISLDIQKAYMQKGIGAPWGMNIGIKTSF